MVEKEATPEKPKQMGNREKMRRKEENWEVVTITMNISIINIKIINTFLINTVIIMFNVHRHHHHIDHQRQI